MRSDADEGGAVPMVLLEIRCIHASVSSELAQQWNQSEVTAHELVERLCPKTIRGGQLYNAGACNAA